MLAAGGVTTTALAAAPPAIQGKVVARPLTPGDKTVYKLPSSMEVSGGIRTVGVGTPVYLEAEITNTIPASDIVGVTWTLTNAPGSLASLTSSPLGTNVPIYEPADRLVYQVAGRTMLRPDVNGQYTVTATITTGNSGSTNVSFTLTASTYMGWETCFLCHSGGAIAPDKSSWQNTAHAQIFAKGIDGGPGTAGPGCFPCHTVGYNLNTNAVNGGFDDVAAALGWHWPTVLTNGNWASMQTNYPTLANLANIQCENCHGPGYDHAHSLGNTNFISRTVASGDCNQCHDAPTHHVKGTEWYISRHAITTRIPSGANRVNCVGCHTSEGFIGRIHNETTTNADYVTTNTIYGAIGCQTCHEPHGETTPANNVHLLRILGSVTMPDGTVVTNAGNGALCLQCHHNRNGSVTNILANYPLGKPTWQGGSSFGPHDGPQGDMIEGVNAWTYGQNIPSSAHRDTVSDLCVGCHMQTVNVGDPAFLQAGGHTFEMSYPVVTNGVTNMVAKTDACVGCHGPITTFDLPRQDYDGDGVIDGVQTEVQHLLDKLSTYLPNAQGVVDGSVKSSLSVKTNWTQPQLEAAYNWQFVNNDGSKGVHNAPYATGLLKASIADLTGDANNDGLPDAWQIQYFGSANSPNAAPNANPAGDGYPNWLKYSLGLDPTQLATELPGGVLLVNGKDIINPAGTNALTIYTAAEISFDTEVGKTYQLQSVSALSAGYEWQTIGTNIVGTGSVVSYVTPTRPNVQQYYRVIHN
jgi:hypothetical protein